MSKIKLLEEKLNDQKGIIKVMFVKQFLNHRKLSTELESDIEYFEYKYSVATKSLKR